MTAELKKIFDGKRAARRDLASKPVGEKLRIVEELTERALATRKDTSAALPDEPWEIPSTWRWKRMGDVAKIVGGGTPRTDRSEYFGGDIPWITPADLSGYTQKTITRGSRSITPEGLANSGAQMLPVGAILFSSRAPIGYVAIAANPVATNQGFKSFVLNDELEPGFVYYYLQRAKELALALASGTTFLEISGKNASRLPIPIPPLAEQHRIVAQIEKQFTRLEAAVAPLRRAQVNLKQYRASLLKAASEGRLASTEARTSASDEATETGVDLLRRILERRQTIARKAPTVAIQNAHSPLPKTWALASLDELLLSITDGDHQPPPQTAQGVPFVVIGNIRSGKVDLSKTRFVSPEYARQIDASRKPRKGDILYTLVGSFGLAVPVDIDEEFCVQRHIAIMRPHELSPRRFLVHVLNSPAVFHQASSVATGTAQKTVPLSALRRIVVPLPPIAMQNRIVDEVEHRLSVIDALEHMIQSNIERASSLRRSILKRAFSGDLSLV